VGSLRTYAALGSALACFHTPVVAQDLRVQRVTFVTNVVPNTSAGKPVTLNATLHLPSGKPPYSVVVITPSSGGEKADRETFYAQELAKTGIAGIVVESFRSRGLTNSVQDQSVLSSWATENDAVGALRWLAADQRFHKDRVGIIGVSKGGATALNTAFAVRRRWTGVGDLAFAAHAPIVPPCGYVQRNPTTTGKPIFFMLAELDDQTPAAPCVNLAEAIRKAGNAKVEVKIYEGAHHAWEALGTKSYFDPKAQNYRNCRGTVEDDGTLITSEGQALPRRGEQQQMAKTCMTLGTHCCGGTAALKAEATRDLVSFFRRSGL
jgi:dienelactone hydrolase